MTERNNIIILGEEYWFNQGKQYPEASYLLKYLEDHRNKKLHNYIILETPAELVETIEKVGLDTIKGIFIFQDIFSDSYLNNKTIKEMRDYMTNIQNKGIFIYPPPDVTNIFGSKQYNLTLKEKLSWASLPHTRVYSVPNYDSTKDEKNIYIELYKNVEDMWKMFKKVVIKKGYSYEGKQVRIFDKEKIKNFKDFKKLAKKLNYKNFWGVKSSSLNIDKGTTRFYILQGYNKIVTDKNNEYRVFFHNGKAKFIANGDMIPNTCLKDRSKKPLGKEIIKFAKKLYKSYIPIFWNSSKHKRLPILFRIDVSYAIDPEYQDEHSIKVEGFDNMIRIYANEVEIDPTSFFYNKFICMSDKNFSSQALQRNMGKYITKYIRAL